MLSGLKSFALIGLYGHNDQQLQISLAPTCSKNFCQSAYPFTTCFVLYQNYVFYGYTKPQAGIARPLGVGYGLWKHDYAKGIKIVAAMRQKNIFDKNMRNIY
jgi:hypothetical protein